MEIESASPAPPSDAIATAIWTLGQAAVLAIYAAGIGLAGGYPAPPEATADLGLAVAQLILAVGLAPALFAGVGRTVRNAVIGLAWTTFAALLADRSLRETLPLLAVMTAWLAVFAVWRRSPVAIHLFSVLTLAGPVLFYVSLEYGPHALALGDWLSLLSPPLGTCTIRLHTDRFLPILPPLLLLLGPTATRFWSKRIAVTRLSR